MKTFALTVASLAAAASLVSTNANAAALIFLNDTIAARIPARDLPDAKAAVAKVLNEAADGSVTEWTSRPNRTNQRVTMALQPQQTVQTGSAGSCRLLSADVRLKKTSENWRFWFCKQSDGSWKASGSQP
jgi:surface antigen